MNTQPPIRPQSLSRSDTPHIFGKHNLGALARLANDFSLITSKFDHQIDLCLVLASRGFAFFEVWSHAVLDSGGSALALLNKRYADSSHVHVHNSNLPTLGGASLFPHSPAPPYRKRLGILPHRLLR
ncbi:hypothetical protein EI94DRAFT_1800814 [Lactarius quietus]|nr:hypothetical protein EI94DRAFT_1815255 [Lactarius quietus]KAF8268149.1 hypothetical protein EI94DRAFT_1800814 [Lactarius quietus]